VNSEARVPDERARRLMMAELDGELAAAERQELERLVAGDPRLQREWKRFQRLKEVTDSMALKPAPPEVWDNYWASVYSRLERGIGWIFVSIGAIILLAYGAWKGVEELLADATLPWAIKAALLALVVGLVVLLVSVAREKLFVGSRERYKDIER
jgi:anti-sigma factor RsiW